MQILKRLIDLLKPYYKELLVVGFLLLTSTIIGLAPPLLQKLIIDEVVSSKNLSRLGGYLIGLGALYALQQLVESGDLYLRHKLGSKFILDLRVKLYAHLQRLSLSFFEHTSTGELMSRVTNDINSLEHFVTHAAAFFLIALIRLVCLIGILLWLNWKLALLVFIPIPILAVSLRWFNTRIRPVYRRTRARLGDINARLQDSLSGMKVIQAFGQEAQELEQFSIASGNYYIAVVQGIRHWATFFPSMRFVTLVGNIIVLGVGALMVVRGNLSLGTLVAFISYLTSLYDPIHRLIDIDNTIQEAIAAAERIFELMDENPDIMDAPGAAVPASIRGEIVFNDVHFKYGTGEEVLQDISFRIAPGEVVALVGPSGAGKTSIANLICRFYDPMLGSITIDSYDLREIKLSSLRKQVSVVLQDTFLFNSTIRENLQYGKLNATEDELIKAAKISYAHEFIQELPDGYDTEIGERGIRLSGGQKQRLALARAILVNPCILILDEATSSVDAEAEYLIQQALESVLKDRTALIIAHRLSTIQNADKIIALEEGQIVEVGSHQELLQRGGLYSQLYKRQVNQFPNI